MVKQAIGPLGTILARNIAPRLLGFANKAVNPLAYKAMGAGLGATAGGISGSAYADEGQKSRGFLVGAITGGVLGGLGGRTLSGFAKGGPDSARLVGLANTMKSTEGMGTRDALRAVTKHMGDYWSNPEHLMNIPTAELATGAKHRPMLGVLSKRPVQELNPLEGSGFSRALGRLSRNILGVTEGAYGVQGKNWASRLGNVVKHDVNEARFYRHNNSRYKRSLIGQAGGVALGSGVGFGVLEGLTATNSDGTPASLPKKLFKGTTTSLSWGFAPQVMGAKMFGYDLPKSIIKPESY